MDVTAKLSADKYFQAYVADAGEVLGLTSCAEGMLKPDFLLTGSALAALACGPVSAVRGQVVQWKKAPGRVCRSMLYVAPSDARVRQKLLNWAKQVLSHVRVSPA